MSEDLRKILDLLAAGKITPLEAERLLAATSDTPATKPTPKFLCVIVDASEPNDRTTVNIRVPLQLLRAGVKLASLLPPEVHTRATAALDAKNISFDLGQLNSQNIGELIEALAEMTVDVDAEGAKVKVFCA